MTNPLTFKNASLVSLAELASAFNAGFEGYFYPMQMTAEILSRRVRMEHIDLELSFLVDSGEEFVGVALFGLRGRKAWCGGLGIAPKFRRRGFGKKLMSEFFSRARSCGVMTLNLEVLTKNTPAIRLYEQFGMRVTRNLLILERTGSANTSAGYSNELRESEPDVLLNHFERLHTWSLAWQRQYLALLSADGIQGFCLGEKDNPYAYVLLVTRPDGVTQILDLAAASERHAEALTIGLTHQCGTMRLVNEPEESLFTGALTANGFVEVERQHEMSCDVTYATAETRP